MSVDRVPDVATLGKSAAIGARHLKHALDRMRAEAQFDDDYYRDPEKPEIHGGGRSREHFVLAAGELGQAYGYLRAVADAAESR